MSFSALIGRFLFLIFKFTTCFHSYFTPIPLHIYMPPMLLSALAIYIPSAHALTCQNHQSN
ncbi:unnamed protein product [Ceratitis capitata]|uniref:(Mediterranean fruit fly) hypothetical protein n=1 Tax=Ceratitis capitata TaxID=7213 RepID=A0A811V5Z5_CERCA|nr:unnamed protein product [Ceratitis capitata]